MPPPFARPQGGPWRESPTPALQRATQRTALALVSPTAKAQGALKGITKEKRTPHPPPSPSVVPRQAHFQDAQSHLKLVFGRMKANQKARVSTVPAPKKKTRMHKFVRSRSALLEKHKRRQFRHETCALSLVVCLPSFY
jgi:hypothetical protein